MIDPIRKKLVRQTVLEALSMAHGFALPETTLRNHVSALLRPYVTHEEWEATTVWLEVNGYMARIPCDFDNELVQWSITERGRTLLKTL